MDNIQMIAMLYKHDINDYEIWWHDLPTEALEKIEAILDDYRHRGCSLRSNLQDIIKDIEDLEK